MESLLKEMTIENVPAAIGGDFQLYNEPFEFDVSPTSTLYYPGCEEDAKSYIEKRKEFEKHDTEEYCYYWNGITPPDSIYGGNANESTRTNVSSVSDSGKGSVENSGKVMKVQESEKEKTVARTEATLEAKEQEKKHSEGAKNIVPKNGHSPVTLETPPRTVTGNTSEKEQSEQRDHSQQSVVDRIKEFFLFCYKENPILSFLAVLLISFAIRYHPHLLKSIVPSFVGGVLFVYLAAIEF